MYYYMTAIMYSALVVLALGTTAALLIIGG